MNGNYPIYVCDSFSGLPPKNLEVFAGEIDWDKGAVKNVTLATFAKGFQDLLGRTATVQETQFANLLNTIFRSLPDDDDNELANPLERLMSLLVFPKKFTKAHLNASFQSADLETNMLYKNTRRNNLLRV